mmetsp:Transcript_12547/g.38039  ORF Transcript_12547/g.38039 Transcript_12547/m.38039 type:complete len:460 (+) Transcript_12547:141-1520(+)
MDVSGSFLPALLTKDGLVSDDAEHQLRRFMRRLAQACGTSPQCFCELSIEWARAGEYAAGMLIGQIRAAEVRRRCPALGPVLDTLCVRAHRVIRTPREHLVTNTFTLGGASLGGFRFEFSSMFGEDDAYYELDVRPLPYRLIGLDTLSCQLAWAHLFSKMGFSDVRLIDAMALVAFLADLSQDGFQVTDRLNIDGSGKYTMTAAQVLAKAATKGESGLERIQSYGPIATAVAASSDPAVLAPRLLRDGELTEDAPLYIEACVRSLVHGSTTNIADEAVLRDLATVWSAAGFAAASHSAHERAHYQIQRSLPARALGGFSKLLNSRSIVLTSIDEIATDGDHLVTCEVELGLPAQQGETMLLRSIRGECDYSLCVIHRSGDGDPNEFGENLLQSTETQWAAFMAALAYDTLASLKEFVPYVCFVSNLFSEWEEANDSDDLPGGWQHWGSGTATKRAKREV